MCGGGLGQTAFDVLAPVAGALTGGALLGPLVGGELGLGADSVLAGALGSGLGAGATSTGIGLANGEGLGKSLLSGAESGGLAGVGSGISGELGGGSFLGTPGTTPSEPSFISNLFSGSSPAITGNADTVASSATPGSLSTVSATPVSGGSGGALGAGGAGGGASAIAAPSSPDIGQAYDLQGNPVSTGNQSVIQGGTTNPINITPTGANIGGATGAIPDLISSPDTSGTQQPTSTPGTTGIDVPTLPAFQQAATATNTTPTLNTGGIDQFLSANPAGGGDSSQLASTIANDQATSAVTGPSTQLGQTLPWQTSQTAGGYYPPAPAVANSVTDTSGINQLLSSAPPAPVGGATGGASTTPPGNSILNAYNNPTTGNILSALGSNAGALTGIAGIGADALEQGKLAKGQKQLLQQASDAQQQSNALESYYSTGTLPPGVQGSINQAAAAQKAAITSKYAAQGSSGSSAEQQDLAAVDAWAAGQGAQTALQLLSEGVTQAGLSSSLYNDIANTAIKQDQSLGSAISAFASSLGGGNSGTIQLKLGQLTG